MRNTTTTRFLTTLLIFSSTGISAGVEPQPVVASNPTTTVAHFLRAIRAGNFRDAARLTDRLDAPTDAIADHYKLNFTGRTTNTTIVGHLELKDTALVIIREDPNPSRPESNAGSTTIDLDPALLVRRGKEWRVLFGLTRYDDPRFIPDDTQKSQFRALSRWFKEQKPKLQAMLQDSGT